MEINGKRISPISFTRHILINMTDYSLDAGLIRRVMRSKCSGIYCPWVGEAGEFHDRESVGFLTFRDEEFKKGGAQNIRRWYI